MKYSQIYPSFFPDSKFVHAEGVYLYDGNKRKYIDLSACAGMAIIGYNNKKIKQTIKKQADKLIISPQRYETEEANILAQKILSLFPQGYNSVVPAVTGSEAVEVALQIAITHTQRKGFLSFKSSYHGHTIGTGALGDTYKNFGYLKKYFKKVNTPGGSALKKAVLMEIEEKLKSLEYAAFVAEGLITNDGYRVIPAGFYKKLLFLCRKYGTLLVFDEVLTGFGRTGKMFSFEHHGIKPDVVCLAKGLASGYMPIAAVVSTRKLVEKYDGFSTFAWSPLACAVANTNIDVILKKRLVNNARKLGDFVLPILKKKFKHNALIKNVRGLGLGQALVFNTNNGMNQIYNQCLDNGILLFRNPYINTLFIMPPLIITKSELEKAIKILIKVIVGECK